MTRSIFDSTTGNAERSGSRFTPPDANQVSQLPETFTNPPEAMPTGQVDFQPPAKEPGIDVSSENDGKLLVINMTGKVHRQDYEQFGPIVERAVQQYGKVRMLVLMHDFHGWDVGGLWEDVKFDAKHFNDIERLAIVGDKMWEKWMATFCKPFTTAEIRFFSTDKTAEARAWIGGA